MYFFIIMVYVIVGYFIAALLHELGHIWMGMLQKFKFYLLVIGPIGIKGTDSGCKFYIEKNKSYWGGVGGTLPIDNDARNINKFSKILIAGPVVSLIEGTVILAMGIFSKWDFLLVLGVMSICIGMTSLIPIKWGMFRTDGGRWLRIHSTNPDKANLEYAIWNIVQSSIIYKGFAQIKQDDINVLLASEDIQEVYLGYYYSYYFNFENSRREQANKDLQNLRSISDKVSKAVRKVYTIEET